MYENKFKIQIMSFLDRNHPVKIREQLFFSTVTFSENSYLVLFY